MPWIACVLAMLGADLAAAREEGQGAAAIAVHGTRWQATSENFVVTSRHRAHDARQVADFCEHRRTSLQLQWSGSKGQAWMPRCQVVVHANQNSYLAAVGAGGGQTFGSSLIAFGSNKQPSKRQIDFRGDSHYGIGSVPHELTHVVLADLLGGRQPPRWADEGMALLADDVEKQRLHRRDLRDAYARRTAFRAVELLALEDHPHPARVAAFYGQSHSLAGFLMARDKPATFVGFLRDVLDHGYDAALRRRYDIADVAELERLWHAEGSAGAAAAVLGAE